MRATRKVQNTPEVPTIGNPTLVPRPDFQAVIAQEGATLVDIFVMEVNATVRGNFSEMRCSHIILQLLAEKEAYWRLINKSSARLPAVEEVYHLHDQD